MHLVGSTSSHSSAVPRVRSSWSVSFLLHQLPSSSPSVFHVFLFTSSSTSLSSFSSHRPESSLRLWHAKLNASCKRGEISGGAQVLQAHLKRDSQGEKGATYWSKGGQKHKEVSLGVTMHKQQVLQRNSSFVILQYLPTLKAGWGGSYLWMKLQLGVQQISM